MGNCLLLDAQQIASILHDYFAEHAAELFQDECAAALESYLVLDRGNVRAVCANVVGDDAIIDWQRVIDKLPHGGYPALCRICPPDMVISLLAVIFFLLYSS